MMFISPPPIVRLEKAFSNPFNNVVATARTCYSRKGIITDDQITSDQRDRIAKNVYQAGHHTTFQHAYFQFSLDHVSRQLVWSFLHNHPFYNSEQVSQRYVKVKRGKYAIPPLSKRALAIYMQTVDFQLAAYEKLIELLIPHVSKFYYERFPARRKYATEYEKNIRKKAYEIARYVLPVATFTYLYHTINGLTLLRYWRICQQADVPLEQKIVVEMMINELLKFDPNYQTILESPLEIPSFDFTFSDSTEFIKEFDTFLDDKTSRLINDPAQNEIILAQAVRDVLGIPKANLSDAEAIAWVLDPARNHLWGESLNLSHHAKLTRCLAHVHYIFRKKISHTADSQNQRHRLTPASRPVLHLHLTEQPDVVIPEILKNNSHLYEYYQQVMMRIWQGISQLRELGVDDEFAMYLLPNAVAVRFTESCDLLNLHHKLKMRLCYNAQEEIWRASLEEAEQIQAVNPVIGQYLLPPCGIRNLTGSYPICPEGDRYCGVKVWRLNFDDYERMI